MNARLCRPNSVKRDRQGRHRSPRWQSCQRRMPPCTAGYTASRHARLERPPERHIGGCAGARVQSGSFPRQAPCRGRCLVASGSLSLTGPRRDAWRVAASSLRCLGWPSRQAPLAGALSPRLEYCVLEWLQRNHGGPWRSPGKPCRGVLRLPVHKFGILGYPYSSTPTGAPGPGPYTVPSAVGPGPKQGTGTRGLGYAVSLSASTAPSPNGTR